MDVTDVDLIAKRRIDGGSAEFDLEGQEVAFGYLRAYVLHADPTAFGGEAGMDMAIVDGRLARQLAGRIYTRA